MSDDTTRDEKELPAWMLSPVANTDYAKRSPAYYAQLLESERTGQCIFCAPGFPNDQRIVWEGHGWVLCECRPRRRDKEGVEVEDHLLFYPRAHGEGMNSEDWAALGAAYEFITTVLGWTGGGLGWRFGDPAISGRTIVHRHMHFLRPRQKFHEDPGVTRAVAVDFPIG